LKPATYASLATLVFVAHRNDVCKSIESAIRSTDALCKHYGLINDLSHMTKYRIIADLINSKILVCKTTAKQKKVKLAQKVLELLPESAT